ncbi:heparinase II/III family protein [Roseicyclus mahoneyensis]|uniref:Putative heparinase superfamily protein n=1 Tax=Roseicyclus mahoneyensis TaxID=164332 RepID=A0A316GGA8_9RHOB|nr:heparinase II/III family protein [Roseicyclus mahoneyensis]PWK60049.1 putative heparinase superfamily protein [Roseicyclus mahoneyensis]
MSEQPDSDTAAPPPEGRVRAADRWAVWRAGLTGPRVSGFIWQPEPSFAGSEARGRQLMAGNLVLGGHLVETAGRLPWDIAPPNEAFLEGLHGFDWLDDLASVPGGTGRKTAQDWLSGWLARYGRGRGPGWTPDLTGRRQMRLITHALMLMNGQTSEDRRGFFAVLARQAGLLQARWRQTRRGLPRFEALTGLVYSACALNGMETALKPSLRFLAQECTTEIDGTGGIATRNPEDLLEVFHLLTWVAAILKDIGKAPDPAVNTAIARIAPTLRSLRHADGTLVRMQGGGRGTPGRLDTALARSNVRPSRLKGLAMGYARMGGRRVSLIVDAAPPLLGPGSFDAHASTLAFELVSGRQPVIVSCGSGKRFGTAWRRAGRATASHSTMTLTGYASARLARGGERQDPERQDFVSGPTTIEVQEAEMKTAEGIALSHDGWRKTHGLVHLRSLQLDRDGSLLRGEDGLAAMTERDRVTLDRVLRRLPGDIGLRYAVRFHLHPDAAAEIDMGGTAVSIQLPGRETWVFRYGGEARLTLEPSVYLDGARVKPRATKQIVLTGALTGYGSAVSWTLARPVGLLPAPGEDETED